MPNLGKRLEETETKKEIDMKMNNTDKYQVPKDNNWVSDDTCKKCAF